MKNIIKIFTFILLIGSLGACKKSFDSLEADPNRATSVPANLIFNNVLGGLNKGAFNGTQRANQFYACNYDYYGNNEYNWTGYSFNNYNILKNIVKMEQESTKSVPSPNPYTALGKFLKAVYIYELTMNLGDVPVSEALKGLENVTPKYDSQKDVFKAVLTYLEDANTEMATVVTKNYVLANDYYYGNNLAKWQKAVNAFKLRVLIQLSNKEADADLNIKQKFADVISNPTRYPLFVSAADQMQFVYNAQFNKYSTSPDNFGFDATRYNMAATYLNTLVSLQDPRTFMVAEPAAAKVAAGAAPNSYAAFVGASSGEDLATMSKNAGVGQYSFINRKRYYQTYTAETSIVIGYSEMCFNIAEAANRGWVSLNAKDWYEKGITASHSFYGIGNGPLDVYFFKAGGKVTDGASYNKFTVNFNQTAYLAQPLVSYAGNNAQGLQQIVVQKYLGFFQNSGWEGYYNYRRTGFPTFSKGGPGTGNSGLIPRRFQYPSSEVTNNKANWQSALNNQFGGKDDINADMWILK